MDQAAKLTPPRTRLLQESRSTLAKDPTVIGKAARTGSSIA